MCAFKGDTQAATTALRSKLDMHRLTLNFCYRCGAVVGISFMNDGSGDLPPSSPTNVKLVKSINQENDGYEEEQIHRRADHWLPQASGGGDAHQGAVPQGGFSDATFYKWRAKFGGMQATDAKRLRELESENSKLKRLLAEAHLDIHALKDVFGVKP